MSATATGVSLKSCSEKLGVPLRSLTEWSRAEGFPFVAGNQVDPDVVRQYLVDAELIGDPLSDVRGPEQAPIVIATDLRSVSVSVPVGDPAPDVYVRRQVNIHLRGAEKVALVKIQSALNQQNARLADGTHVASAANAVRWVLQQVARLM